MLFTSSANSLDQLDTLRAVKLMKFYFLFLILCNFYTSPLVKLYLTGLIVKIFEKTNSSQTSNFVPDLSYKPRCIITQAS